MHEQLPQSVVHRVSPDVTGNDRPIYSVSCDNPNLAIIRRIAARGGQGIRDLTRGQSFLVAEDAIAAGQRDLVSMHVFLPSVRTPISNRRISGKER